MVSKEQIKQLNDQLKSMQSTIIGSMGKIEKGISEMPKEEAVIALEFIKSSGLRENINQLNDKISALNKNGR